MSILRLLRVCWEWLREPGPTSEPELRSLKLMRDWLSPAQREQFDTDGYFDVLGSHTGRRYRIRLGTATNINELDGFEGTVARWCFVPGECLPAGDVMLAQKIALENDEQSALAVARSFYASP